jgi:hypothetical protein
LNCDRDRVLLAEAAPCFLPKMNGDGTGRAEMEKTGGNRTMSLRMGTTELPPRSEKGVCFLPLALSWRAFEQVSQVQLPIEVDFYTVLLGIIVCVGLVVIVVLAIAFVRSGRQPRPTEMREEPSAAGPRTCPECGHVIGKADERFCVRCGARLPE